MLKEDRVTDQQPIPDLAELRSVVGCLMVGILRLAYAHGLETEPSLHRYLNQEEGIW